MCLTLTLTFQGHLIFVNSPFVPLHDWCKFWSDIFINSGDIAHWNMEKLPILYNGNFRCHGNVCYVFPINAFFCKLHRIGPSNMCVNFEKDRLKIDDCRSQIPFFINSTISHWLTYKIVKISKWPWPLTFIWPWPCVWPLTLTIWRNTFFLKLFILFEVTWRKNVTSYVKTDGRIQKRHSIRNVVQPTRSLYHFRFKCYGPLCDFHWFSLKSRDVKTWRGTSKRRYLVEAECYKGTLCN